MHQAIDSTQDIQIFDEDIYSDTTSNSEFDILFDSSLDGKFNTNNQLNGNMVSRLMKNADNMAELVSLNKYVDELETELWQNLISTQVEVNAKPI